MNTRFRRNPSRSLKRTVVGLAAFLLLSVVPLVTPAAAADGLSAVEVLRYGGDHRYATSQEIAQAFVDSAEESPDTVVMVSGVKWTDAVVAASVVGRFDAPVLLTPPDHLLDDALDWLTDLDPARIVVVSADPPDRSPTVETSVTDALTEAGFVVERVSGNDQYRTGVAAARRLDGAGELAQFGPTAVIASGEVFADALVAGPFAVRNRLPVLLTPKARLHSDVSDYLSEAGIKRVVLMGGTAALSADVQNSIEALGIGVDRIAGATRFETATLLAEYAARHTDDCFDGSEVGLARADVPFDSLGAAPLLAQLCAPVVLADPHNIPSATEGFLNSVRSGHDRITLRVFGGDAAVSQSAIDKYLAKHRPAGAHYKNRSRTSVLPATDRYFIDHDEVAALFPNCDPAPATNENTLRKRRGLMDRLSGWDTEITQGTFGDGTVDFVTGWWDQEQLDYFYGDTYPGISVEWAKQNITMWSWNQIGFGWRSTYRPPSWSTGPTPTARAFSGLYQRLVLDGFTGVKGEKLAHEFVHHLGAHRARRVDLDNDKAWPRGGGQLLWDWTGYMIQYPPVDREPAAWGMHTLLTTRNGSCVARTVLARCDAPFTEDTSPHLRNDDKASPLGLALWNLVCGEYPQ